MRLQNEARLISANEELRERELNLQQLLTHAPDAVIVIDAESTVTYWNPKAEQVFGWTSEEVIGKKLGTAIIPPQHREAHDRGMHRYLSTGEARMLNKTVDITALDKSGREFYISLTISTTKQNGKTAFIAFLRDIDRQKRNELELEKKREELEISNRELEQFAHVASHDMKEPIRKVRLFAARLKQENFEELSDQAQSFVNKIQVSAERLMNMVDGILSYSSAGAEMPQMERVDLNKIIEDIRTDLELLIEQKNAVIKSRNLPEITGVPFLLHQLFYNLIINSLKFSKPEVAPLIEITCGKTGVQQMVSKPLNNNNLVEIIVKDNGIGFPNEYSGTIFEKFLRLHSKTKYEGTGLGLALCKKIVELHGGTISATGELNKGATFRIVFPLQQAL